MYDKYLTSKAIKEQALLLGFDACGIVSTVMLHDEKSHFEEWLHAGYHGELSYMERNQHLRIDPSRLVEGTRSAIVVLLNYHTRKSQPKDAPKVAKYAYGEDYHYVVKGKLQELLRYVQELVPEAEGRGFSDSAPILEHALARRAGLGWIGKNSLLLTQKGSYYFIGELMLNIELAYDKPFVADYCGRCRRCIDACPTQAIVKEKVVNASKCISYHTIERKGDIPNGIDLGNSVFGCDICQDVCPWNAKAIEHSNKAFEPKEFLNLSKDDWYKMTQEDYQRYFSKSPVKRAGYEGLKKSIEYIKKQSKEDDE